ncbi:pilus assembly protein PilM [soil metagenome]
MSILSGVSDFFGLDIGTSAIRVVELKGNGPVKTLHRYGQVSAERKVLVSDSRADQQKLAQVVRDLIAQIGISSKNVAVGISSNRVFTAVFDMERLSQDELKKTLQFQAGSMIPTPIDESKVDWALIGDSPADKTKVEILLSSVPNELVEKRLDVLESIGLNVIAFEPDNLALVRSMIPPNVSTPHMVLDIGHSSTDLVIVMNGAPRLTRAIPTGTEAFVKAAVQNLSIDQSQAEQFVFKFGLSKDKLEGQIHQAIIGTVDQLVSEIEKSIKFFQARYVNTALQRIIVTGGASTLPEFPLYIANKFGISVEIGNAWCNTSFPPNRQNELLAESNYYGVAAGLAERRE